MEEKVWAAWAALIAAAHAAREADRLPEGAVKLATLQKIGEQLEFLSSLIERIEE